MDMGITRRSFIATTALAAAATSAGVAYADEEASQTIEADVVVVGCGTAGLTCGVAAAQKGASVVVIGKDETPSSQGGSNFAVNSKVAKELGVEIDADEAVRHLLQINADLVSEGQWYTFANRSGEAMDWLIDLVEPAGLSVTLEVPMTRGMTGVIAEYTGSHVFYGGPQEQPFGDQPDVLDALVDVLTGELGQRVDLNTTVTSLVRADGGRVEAAIAQNADGATVRYVANKAVVLATGDYGNNADLVDQYCPLARGLVSMKYPANNTGDGHLMAMEIGAAMQRNPMHGAMIFGNQYYRNLNVNIDGKRFMNEFTVNAFSGVQALMQNDSCYWSIWDADFANNWQDAPLRYTQPDVTPEEQAATFESGVEGGTILKAETLEELAEAMGIPAEALAQTVERYNGFCEAGVDKDYHKQAEILFPVATPPFYATKVAPNLLITLGGLDVNDDMQVRDTEGKVIEGLYALGATAGNFYGNLYTTYFAGVNMGRCVTFGYLLGNSLADL